jgi:hypothetical protein
MKRVHRKLHFGHKGSAGLDAAIFVDGVHRQLGHLKLGFLFQMRTPAAQHHTIARCLFALGLDDKAHAAALRGEVGEWTQRKVRNPALRSPIDRARAKRRRRQLQGWRKNHRQSKVDVMFDAVEPSQIPVDAPCVAGYTGGAWPTYHELDDLFPHAHHVSIAISASEDADILDVEPGDASPDQAPGWAARQIVRRKKDPHFYNLSKPVVYGSVSSVAEIRHYLHGAGLLDEVNIMSAHIGEGEHICGPDSCGYPGIDEPVAATQHTWTALGRNLDESKLGRDFF